MSGMKFPTLKSFIAVGAHIAICLITVGCHKTVRHKMLSPEAAQQLSLGWNLKTTVEAYNSAGYTDSKWNYSAETALNEWRASDPKARIQTKNWGSIIWNN